MKTEAIVAIEYLLEKLDGGLECHCDVFRKVYGMKSETAERRLREWRGLYNASMNFPAVKEWEKATGEKTLRQDWFRAPGYTAHSSAHKWTFTRPFINFLKQQIRAAANLEKQNAKV